MTDKALFLRPATVLAAVLALAGCSMTPEYQRPPLAVPATLPATSTASAPMAAPATAVADLPWQRYFPDTRLQQLIGLALDGNRDLRVAALNIEALRAAYAIQDADRFPSVNGVANAARQRATSRPFAYGNSVQAGVSISAFELDLFGRVRALSEAAGAQLMASESARRATHISLVASVASTWYTLWADRWQLALAEQTLATRESSLKLQQLKFDNGVLNELDLRTAQSLVEAARVTRAQARRQWAQDLSALELLLGRSAPAELLPPAVDVGMPAAQAGGQTTAQADALAQTVSRSLWPELAELPVGLSSEVLLQRPDIVQAEQNLVAANANVGAARAARFPRISLTASLGVASTSLAGLFNDGLLGAAIAPGVTVPLLDWGRTAAGVDSAVARRDIALAQYDRTVQSAFKDVADALVARQTWTEQAQAQRAQTEAEATRLRLSTLRYESGVASQLDLLDAQRALFASQQSLITAQLARQQAHIAVYRSLGGGWETSASQQAAATAR